MHTRFVISPLRGLHFLQSHAVAGYSPPLIASADITVIIIFNIIDE